MSQQLYKNGVGEAILKTIAFFDLFDYPLTAFEIYQYLDKKFSLSDIIGFLDEEVYGVKQKLSNNFISGPDASSGFIKKDIIQVEKGFYFLSGRQAIIKERSARYNFSVRKLKIARRFARFFALCPFVRAVAMANSLGAHNFRDGSDIDFFIVVRPGRLWLGRLYCAGLAKVMGRRPRSFDKKDKLCLSFYLPADKLCLDDLKLTGGDPYFDAWRKGLVWLEDKDYVREAFLRANDLTDSFLGFKIKENKAVAFDTARKIGVNFILNIFEKLAEAWQLMIMPPALKEAAQSDSDGVVIGKRALKFYLRDRRREFKEKYEHKINEILL